MLPKVREGLTDETQEAINLRVLSINLNQLIFSQKKHQELHFTTFNLKLLIWQS